MGPLYRDPNPLVAISVYSNCISLSISQLLKSQVKCREFLLATSQLSVFSCTWPFVRLFGSTSIEGALRTPVFKLKLLEL